MEVYVDDVLVKSVRAEDHVDDLQETFTKLRKNNMRLNPAKSVRVILGKFLGFMITSLGIKANPNNIPALFDHRKPGNTRDVQKVI